MDKLWAMRVFARVVECGSLSRAAESLELANATVTSCVRNLEKSLGVVLLNRTTRKLRLTDEGSLFYPHCKEVLERVDRVENDLRTKAGEVVGTLRVEMPIAIGHSLICRAIPIFARQYPSLTVSVILTNQPHNLMERAIDVAIRMDHVEDETQVARPIYEARYIVCGSPRFVKSLAAVHPIELDPRTCLGQLLDGSYRPREWAFGSAAERICIRPEGPLNFNSSEALITAAMQDAGLVYVLDLFARRHIEAGDLVQVFGDCPTAVRTFYAVAAKSRYRTPRIRAFTEFLLETLKLLSKPSLARPVRVRPIQRPS
jgi:LysR family transcriptional regulator, regulator for bpeEF and oprC